MATRENEKCSECGVHKNDMHWEPKFYVGFHFVLWLWGIAIGVVAMIQ